MASLLIAIIYIAFISLGLPDSLLGAAWPTMVTELSVPLSYAGIVSMIISGGTVASSLFSDKITQRLGAGLVTALSTALTAIALFGFSVSKSFIALCIFAIPYGLGAGAIDAALNNYVAVHYASRQMNWLHCFWGLGAGISPYIMGYAIGTARNWSLGYSAVSVIQIAISVLLFASLPLWKRRHGEDGGEEYEAPLTIRDSLKIRGVAEILIAFFCYCAFEATAMLWSSTYLVSARGADPKVAADLASLFFIGITAGRYVCGFISDRLGDKKMIRIGLGIVVLGTVMVALPVETNALAFAGLITIGLGAAPVYPSIIHSTPEHFGKENSHAIVGIQMASAYLGTTLVPPLFGVLAEHISAALFPAFIALFVIFTLVMTERTNRLCKKQ